MEPTSRGFRVEWNGKPVGAKPGAAKNAYYTRDIRRHGMNG
jgi:hypothetical protein